jgi:hypothetical protein
MDLQLKFVYVAQQAIRHTMTCIDCNFRPLSSHRLVNDDLRRLNPALTGMIAGIAHGGDAG